MNDKFNHPYSGSREKTTADFEKHDDLRVLSLAFSLPEINYIDISRQARLTKMMARWPLLAELKESAGSQ